MYFDSNVLMILNAALCAVGFDATLFLIFLGIRRLANRKRAQKHTQLQRRLQEEQAFLMNQLYNSASDIIQTAHQHSGGGNGATGYY